MCSHRFTEHTLEGCECSTAGIRGEVTVEAANLDELRPVGEEIFDPGAGGKGNMNVVQFGVVWVYGAEC